MTLEEARRDARSVFWNGTVGLVVFAAFWLLSSSLGVWVGREPAVVVLVAGGLSFSWLSTFLLRWSGHLSTLDRLNPLNDLSRELSYFVPVTFPLVGLLTHSQVNVFYPGCMAVTGVYYALFVYLFGLWQYAILSGILLASALGLAMGSPLLFTPGGWITGLTLLIFAGWVYLADEPRFRFRKRLSNPQAGSLPLRDAPRPVPRPATPER